MEHKNLVIIARQTGLWYLLLAISGMLGFLFFHSQIFLPDNPEKTLSNLIELKSISRIRLILELIIIASQALAAVWFYKLFRELINWAAFAIAGWGLLNSAAILISAISMSSAITIANFASPSFQEKISFIQLLSTIISSAWTIGGLFFGLWLIPMGYVILKSLCMPKGLGWTLILGGAGYILNTLFSCSGYTNSLLDILTIPATVGEFWIIGYLLVYGIRPTLRNK